MRFKTVLLLFCVVFAGACSSAVPTDEMARDVLTILPIEVCDGILFFHVPGGVHPGRWVLEIKLEESVVEIPFFLD